MGMCGGGALVRFGEQRRRTARGYDEHLRTQLGNVDHLHVGLPREAADPSHKSGLGDEERRVFAAIDGRKTVAELKALELLKESELDRLLYAMKCTRLVRLSEAPLTVHSRFDLQ